SGPRFAAVPSTPVPWCLIYCGMEGKSALRIFQAVFST
ncbi:hypothetical protein CFII64_02921, partial [Pseudomonas sp. CFII64]